MKMETLQQRRDELERKEQELKKSLLKFDKFVKVRTPLALPHLSYGCHGNNHRRVT